MKRLAAVAVVVVFVALPVCAQRGGGSHGGFSGGHGGFSGSRGFSGSGGISHGGFSGFRGSAPARFSGPPTTRFGGSPPVRYSGPSSVRFGGPSAPRSFHPPTNGFAGAPHYVSNRPPYQSPGMRTLGPRTVTPR